MTNLADKLESILRKGDRLRMGEIVLSRPDAGCFRLCHHDDSDVSGDLALFPTPEKLREFAKTDAIGAYRPLKTAPTLRPGWVAEASSAEEMIEFVDAVYPGAFATWVAYHAGTLDPVALRTTLERQSGMHAKARNITDQQVNQIMRQLCAKNCLRTIAWPIDDRCPCSKLPLLPGKITLTCTEACTFAVSMATELASSVEGP